MTAEAPKEAERPPGVLTPPRFEPRFDGFSGAVSTGGPLTRARTTRKRKRKRRPEPTPERSREASGAAASGAFVQAGPVDDGHDLATRRGVSTYVVDVHRDLDSALRAFFDLPPTLPIERNTVGDGALDKLVVRVPSAHLGLELRPAGADPTTTLGGTVLDLRLYDLGRPARADVVRAVLRRFRRLEPADGPDLLARARRSFVFRDLGDFAFRDLSPAHGGMRAILRLGSAATRTAASAGRRATGPSPRRSATRPGSTSSSRRAPPTSSSRAESPPCPPPCRA